MRMRVELVFLEEVVIYTIVHGYTRDDWIVGYVGYSRSCLLLRFSIKAASFTVVFIDINSTR